MPTRRHFLNSSIALCATPVIYAIEPITRSGKTAKIELSLAAYSFNKALDLKKSTMTLFDFLDFAAKQDITAVELTSYYFAETTNGYIKKLRDHADKLKLAVSGVPVRNDFCQLDDAKRQADIDHVTTWVRHASALGAKTVRIFAGNLPKGDTLEKAQKRVVDSIEKCLPAAEKAGVILALENHGGITGTPEQLLALVKPIKSAYLGVNIDTGNFKTANPYADVEKIIPYGVVCQFKTEVFPDGKKQRADLKKIIGLLKTGNYHGYVALEYEAGGDPLVEVPKVLKSLKELLG
jgi:sugar phosphate isomerase/epimerase